MATLVNLRQSAYIHTFVCKECCWPFATKSLCWGCSKARLKVCDLLSPSGLYIWECRTSLMGNGHGVPVSNNNMQNNVLFNQNAGNNTLVTPPVGFSAISSTAMVAVDIVTAINLANHATLPKHMTTFYINHVRQQVCLQTDQLLFLCC